MDRRLRILLGLTLALTALPYGCGGDDDDDDDDVADGDADADADCDEIICDGEGEGEEGEGEGEEGEGEGEGGEGEGEGEFLPCEGADVCDEECGIVGAACRNDRQCELQVGAQRLALTCLDEQQYGFPNGYCAGLPSVAQPHPCDPDDDRTCPADHRGICIDDPANDISYCFRSCNVTDENWADSNCGCREGYECGVSDETCAPGCRIEEQDQDCCRRWEDLNMDGESTPNEFVEIEGCESVCDPNTYRCTNDGGDAPIGGACISDQDCPANGRCLVARGTGEEDDDTVVWEGGYCVLDACDLEGRECTGDSNCVNAGTNDDPFWICLSACTVADERIVDKYSEHNPECRDGYGCVGDADLGGNDACDTDDDCDGARCIGGICNGNGYCSALAETVNGHIHFCDTVTYPGTGCPGDDAATAGWDESQRCVDDVCQARCDADHACAADTICTEDGFCQFSNVGGPCADAQACADDDECDTGEICEDDGFCTRQALNEACVSPYGQGLCALGGIFGEMGMCLLQSCDAVGMEDNCTDGKSCENIFGGFFCVDECDLPAEDCTGAETCQGNGVGCAAGMACLPLQEGETTGLCLASCTDQEDPDQYCEDNFGEPFTSCNADSGVCVQPAA